MLATSITTLVATASFSFIASLSPGINTLMLANSGANFGMNKTMPMLLGCSVGLLMIMLLVAFGAGQLFVMLPWLKQALLYACSIYLMYLGYQLAFTKPNASLEDKDGSKQAPISFKKAVMMQAINPGIWILAVATMGFAAQIDSNISTLLIICGLVTLVNLPAIAIWAVSGSAINNLIKKPRNNSIFKGTLAGLTFLTIPMLWMAT